MKLNRQNGSGAGKATPGNMVMMQGMTPEQLNIKGLSEAEVPALRKKYGPNTLAFRKENRLWSLLKSLSGEPMVLLLLLAAILYFVSGQTGDGIFMACAILLVSGISLYQDARSRQALEKLKTFTQPSCTVIRDGELKQIDSHALVVGDFLMLSEGSRISADGEIVHSNDFSVNESLLTGESEPVSKDKYGQDKLAFAGTTVTAGLAIIRVTGVGLQTRLGKIGLSMEEIEAEKTPLERQISAFVKKMVWAGFVVFLIVWAINYFKTYQLLDSLLKALTLAMSILPEEIPVAFTTFMAIGAWRLMQMGIVVKQMKTVETLGSATVICTDKTGTLTENKMNLAYLYHPDKGSWESTEAPISEANRQLVELAMWASEPIPFDPMEQALHRHYEALERTDERPAFRMVHEYPLSGKPPMMTHVFENSLKRRIIAAKGAPEAIWEACNLSVPEINALKKAVAERADNGFRVLGVAESGFEGNEFPVQQTDLPFSFRGLVAFHDPPKPNIAEVLQAFYRAGIKVKIITGDNAGTTSAIAKQVGLQGAEACISGPELMGLEGEALERVVQERQVFTRMFPEAKLKVINALKAQGEVVAMTGDGVNDGPALKAANIGIAMGKRGTEIARQAASLVLADDNLARMADAVAMGRRIYTNLKKAIQYIISIHIPIILTVFLPLALGWVYPNIFTPVHIIFMELIMGPTCSIVYENEPMEKNAMIQPPRPFTTNFFNWRELSLSMVQGLAITAGALAAYQYAVKQGIGEEHTRTLTFVALITANIFLSLVNRSFYYSCLTTLGYKNRLMSGVILATLLLTAFMLFYPPFTRFFGLQQLSLPDLGWSVMAGFLSVIWFEGYKWWKRSRASVSI